MTFYELLNKPFFLWDGGFGTELMARGLGRDFSTELAVFTHPDLVEEISRDYVNAGAKLVMADTFGANSLKLSGTGHTVEEAINCAVSLAKKGADGKALVGLDVSTPGVLLEPAGELTYEKAYEIFKEVCILGEAAGADVICLETFTDLREIKIAMRAAKENTSLPVTASMTFLENGRTLSGDSAAAFSVTAGALGIDALGVNCALGPKALSEVVSELLKYSSVPVIVKPNAGLPDPESGKYTVTPEEFAADMLEFYRKGAVVLGGCCGTTPEHIALLGEALKNEKQLSSKSRSSAAGLISGKGKAVCINSPHIIGERINPTGKKQFREAILRGDTEYIVNQGIEQVAAGAEILDVNVGVSGIDEKEMLVKAVKALQAAVDVPLQIDSASPEAVEAALKVYTGKALINSVNASEESLNKVLPLAKKYGAAVVGLTLDENGIPETAEQRLELCDKIIDRAKKEGIPEKDIAIDCLTLTVGTDQKAAVTTLKAMRLVKEKYNSALVLGVSNVSFGLPGRNTVNAAFLITALANGLTLPIINPNLPELTSAFYAAKLLNGNDIGGREYIAHALGEAKTPEKKELSLSEAVYKGLKAEAARLAGELLKINSADEITNTVLIPSLDTIGRDFETGKLFLPQLVLCAEAAGAAFAVVRQSLKSDGNEEKSKGIIILATVKGDVHDIGKNIVRSVLENYGYTVVDLGKDVSPEKIVAAAKETNTQLVGLSALMTTTLPAMKETIAELKSNGIKAKIMVGGAVLTRDYALEIGADFYARDAKESADIAKTVFGN